MNRAILAFALLVLTGPAMAIPSSRDTPAAGGSLPKLTGNPITDIQNAANGSGAPQASGPLGELSAIFASDFAAAQKLATSTSIQDGNGQACWAAFAPFGEIINAHPEMLTGKLATDIEAKRLAMIAARNLCNNVACNTVFTEEAAMVQSLPSMLPVSINVNLTPINLFAQACAHVPTLQVAPVSVAPVPIETPVSVPAGK